MVAQDPDGIANRGQGVAQLVAEHGEKLVFTPARLAHGLLGLQTNVGQQIAFAGIEADAAGVDDGELAVAPLDGAVQPIAGGAWFFVDDGAVLADETVEQGRLANVGSTHQRHDGHVASLVLAELAMVLESGSVLVWAWQAPGPDRPAAAWARNLRASGPGAPVAP